eukprot:jgi/Chrzof1/12253/Cz06g27090.t1
MVGVGFASALAGQASRHTRKFFERGGNPLQPAFWDPIDVEDALLDSVLGIFIFKSMGGRFSSLMPSDLSKPGSLAFESIPAKSDEYAQPSIKRELVRIFKRDGCHHCGATKGPVIGDHMPPNKVVYGKGEDRLAAWLAEQPVIGKVRGVLGMSAISRQRFYPQCQRCSIKQSAAIKHGKRVLVLHLHSPKYRTEHLAGLLVGLRHNVPPMQPPSYTGGKGNRQRWNPLHLTAFLPRQPSVTIHDAAEDEDDQHEGGVTLDQNRSELMMSLDHWMPQTKANLAGTGSHGLSSHRTAPDFAHAGEDIKRQQQVAFERHFKSGLV